MFFVMTHWAFSNHHILQNILQMFSIWDPFQSKGKVYKLLTLLWLKQSYPHLMDPGHRWPAGKCELRLDRLAGRNVGSRECFLTRSSSDSLMIHQPRSSGNSFQQTWLLPKRTFVCRRSSAFRRRPTFPNTSGCICQLCRNLCLGGRFHI